MLDPFMSDAFELFERTMGSAFPGKPSTLTAPKPKVTIEELIRRKKSVVRVDGKLYRVEVSEVSA